MSVIEYNHIQGDDIYTMLQILKALADENRLRITNLLNHGEFCVCEIETMLNMSQSNVSRHLSKLKNTGIINYYKDAQWVKYTLNEEFKTKNENLFLYLKNEFENNELFKKDMERYHKYKEKNLSCQLIKSDKEKVENLIK